jgi:hypothetical protein
VLVLAVTVAAVAGCGGSSGGPEQAVMDYLRALADNDGRKACDLLTVEARALLVAEAGTTDCPALVDEFHSVLGGDAERLKSAEVSGGDANADSTTVTVTLERRSVDVDVQKVGGSWRLNSSVANYLLGIPPG